MYKLYDGVPSENLTWLQNDNNIYNILILAEGELITAWHASVQNNTHIVHRAIHYCKLQNLCWLFGNVWPAVR